MVNCVCGLPLEDGEPVASVAAIAYPRGRPSVKIVGAALHVDCAPTFFKLTAHAAGVALELFRPIEPRGCSRCRAPKACQRWACLWSEPIAPDQGGGRAPSFPVFVAP